MYFYHKINQRRAVIIEFRLRLTLNVDVEPAFAFDDFEIEIGVFFGLVSLQ